MSLATQIAALATAVGNYLRDNVTPRLLPSGGTTGQVLAKTSATDYAATWQPAGVGGASATQITLAVPANSIGGAEIVVADATVTATSKIMASMAGEADAENDLEELYDSDVRVFATPESGQIRFFIKSIGAIVGDFKVNYQVFA